MGYEKDRQIEQDEQGWDYRDGTTICSRCLSDPYLRKLVKDQASEFECSFCGWTSRKAPNSIPFNRLMEVYAGAVFQYYSHAENEAIAWDPEDEKYVGSTHDTWDLVRYVIGEPSEQEAVVQEIIDSLGDHVWCEKSPYALTGAEQYETSWDDFCNTVKHEVRYFFDSKTPDEYSEKIPVPEMLDELRDIIQEAGLIAVLPAGTKLFRIRPHTRQERCDSWQSLGPPPPDVAVTNRMSAAGISVFYAGMDPATAKAETLANLPATDQRVLTGATWTNTRPLNILDLTKLPPVPSFYARVRYDRDHLIFLREFVKSITQPVEHDGREHTEYVPSQIVTEYFRHRYRTHHNVGLDGIIYPSARHKCGRSIVIFASQDDLTPRLYPWETDRIPILSMDQASVRRLRRTRRKSQ